MSAQSSESYLASRVENLIDITHRLSDVLSNEIALLNARKINEISALQDDKFRLSDAYAARIHEIESNREIYKQLAPRLKQRLQEATRNFQDIVQQNMRTVMAKQQANGKVVEAIVSAIRDQSTPHTPYTKNGQRYLSRPSMSARPAATQVSEQI